LSTPDQLSGAIERLLLVRRVEEFFYREAQLLDERRFEEWLDLLADDMRYWMPMTRNVRFDEAERAETRERQDVNWFDEGKDTLRLRVQQIRTGVHWAEEPLSRTCHCVTNVQLDAVTPDTVSARSRFLIYRNRGDTEVDLFAGKREDLLARAGDGLLLRHRKIVLDQNVLLAKNLTIFF
jgi:3-phenylpropionate/cinnamic acid dioxygenase small subunit